MELHELEDGLWEIYSKREQHFEKRLLNFDNEEMGRFDSFEDFLSSLSQGEALRLLFQGY